LRVELGPGVATKTTGVARWTMRRWNGRLAPSSCHAPRNACRCSYRRKIENNGTLEAKFARLLSLARRVREQQQRQRGPKVYSLHAPEVECIGKGKAHRPYEFGVKISVATTLKHCKGGQFVTHVKALPGNPYDAWQR
jgi:hypothetical protein